MKRKEKIRYDGAKPLLVLPYVIVTGAALMYTICRDYMWICSAAIGIFACAVYMLIYRFRKRPVAVVLVTMLLEAVCGVALFFARPVFAENGFMDFMFTASTFFNPLYAAISIVIFSVIIGFVCCYFSAVMPRMCFLMLVAFVPLILSARTAGGLPMWLLVPMFGTFVLAVCGSAKQCPPQDVAVYRDARAEKQRAAAAVFLAALSVFVAAVVPRSHKTPMGEFLNQVFIQGDGYYQGGDRLSNFVSRSSVNTGDNNPSDTLLFTVQTEAPVLIDRWAFDVYDGANGWSYLEDYNTGYAGWEKNESLCRPAELADTLRRAVKDDRLEGYEQLADVSRVMTDTQYMFIRVMDGSATRVVLHPLTTVQVDITGYDGGIYRTPKGELFTDDNIASAEYLVKYHAEDVNVGFANAFGEIDFSQLMYDAGASGVIDNSTYSAYMDEHKRAQSYLRRTGDNSSMSLDLMMLALEITEDCTTDYEKACAIEKWFGENGFVYDMDFVPRYAEVNYFVLESKRGICSDYATALTLMARSVGLPARYVEGFALSEEMKDENGIYNVTAANAHAYSQIYIEGCGWVNFDATRFVPQAENNDLTTAQIIMICVAAAVVLMLIALAVIFRERLGWMAFSAAYHLRSEASAVRALSERMRKIAARLSGTEFASMTTGEAEKIIANQLNMGGRAAELRAAADELLYSGTTPTDIDRKRLYRCLADIVKQKRRMKR